MTQNTWFNASKEGLRKLLQHLPKTFVVNELVQNVWDEKATVCEMTIERIEGTPYVRLTCRDDVPDGFKDLTHAYTIWAESAKKANPEQSGLYNEGEKKVLALCRSAEISSTTGTVIFREDGTRTSSRRKTEAGSVFVGEMRITREEVRQMEAAFRALLPDGSCETTLNGEEVEVPEKVCEFEVVLATRVADDEGQLKPTRRKTVVQLFEPREGERATLYERGIPVVETGDRFHVNVMQKVPLNRDRDNVTPGYLRAVRGAVLVHAADLLSKEDAAAKWVDDGAMHDSVEKDTLDTVLDKRHGKKRALYDGADLEANKSLQGSEYEVIGRGSLDKDLRKKILDTGAGRKSGDIRPTPKPFSNDPEAPVMEEIPFSEWTEGMREVADICRHFAEHTGVHDDLLVRYGLPPQRWWRAAWGAGFIWNVTSMGRRWFDSWYEHPVELLSIIIHELSHDGAPDHLADAFHQNCTSNGAKVAMLVHLHADAIPHWHKVREHRDRSAA